MAGDKSGQSAASRPRLGRRLEPEDFYDTPACRFPLATRVFTRVVIAIVYAFSKLYWRWTTDGPNPFRRDADSRETHGTGRVLVCNHASMFDPVVLVLIARHEGRFVRLLYKSELDKVGAATWLFCRVGAMPIKRDTADMKAIRRAVKALKAGDDVCIFPEGTRVKDPLARPPLHGGFAMIAQMAGCDVIPIAIDGSEMIVPSGKGFSRPAKVRVRFGKPVTFAEVDGATRREKAELMEEVAMGRVYEMRMALREEHGRSPALPKPAGEER